MNSRRSFLQRLAQAVVIAATAPIIVREALGIEKQVIGNLTDMDAIFFHQLSMSTLADYGPHFYDWVIVDDRKKYLADCQAQRDAAKS